ncbi:MAG: hypothetical protein ACYDG2_20285 [Ruminiclostridium sp.]
MNFLTLLLFDFISIPLLAQLEVFKTALLCFINMWAMILCCKLISGHFTMDLNIIGRFNLLIITIYQIMKDPSLTVSMEKENVIFQNTGGFLCSNYLKAFLKQAKRPIMSSVLTIVS